MLDRPYLGRVVGYPGVRDRSGLRRPAGRRRHRTPRLSGRRRTANPDATANPGNVHLCLAVDDCRVGLEARGRAAAPARSCRTGPVDVDARPEHGRPRRLSAHPRRHHARAVPDAAGEARGEDGMIKRVSLVRRKDGLTHEEFFAHWMGPHAEIVKQLPGAPRPALRRGPELDAGGRRLGRRRRTLVRQHRGRRPGLRDRAASPAA